MNVEESLNLVKDRLVSDAYFSLKAVLMERDILFNICRRAIEKSELVTKDGNNYIIIPYDFVSSFREFKETDWLTKTL